MKTAIQWANGPDFEFLGLQAEEMIRVSWTVEAIRAEALEAVAQLCVRQCNYMVPDTDSQRLYIAAMLSIATKIRNGEIT